MVLLVTIGLVIVSALTLALGFIQDNVGLIYASIACSVAAAVILIIAGRNSGAAKVTTASGPAALDATPRGSDDEFPIADYDELLVTEVVPLLSELTESELQVVRAREESGKARASVLRRIDSELESREASADVEYEDDVEYDDEDDFDEPTMAVPAVDDDEASDDYDDEEPFPIEEYDDLRASEIMPLLPQLYADELDLVAEREREGANRKAILDKIDELLNTPLPGAATPAAPKKSAAKKAAPAKKASAPVKQAAASANKAASAKKASTPVNRAAPAKKAATATKKAVAPAKRAAAPAKKAATAAKKAATPVKKAATPVKKAPAKRAAPAKKTAAPAKKAPAKRS